MQTENELPLTTEGTIQLDTMDTRIWFITPFLSLLKSRKFLVSMMTMAVDLLVAYVPQAEGIRVELLTVFTFIGSMLVAAIAYEDGQEKRY
jgi:hypothetical protein